MSQENVLAAKYGRALFLLAQEQDQVEQVLTELLRLEAAFGQGKGQEFLSHPWLTLEKKMGGVQLVLAAPLLPLLERFLRLVIEKKRAGILTLIVTHYQQEWEQYQKRKKARLISAVPLSAQQLELLRQRLQVYTGTEVDLLAQVDKRLGAGVRIEIGDLVLDGSLLGQLSQLRRTMLKEN